MSDVLGVAGLACLSAAGFLIDVTAGLAATGVSLLYAAWRLGRR